MWKRSCDLVVALFIWVFVDLIFRQKDAQSAHHMYLRGGLFEVEKGVGVRENITHVFDVNMILSEIRTVKTACNVEYIACGYRFPGRKVQRSAI